MSNSRMRLSIQDASKRYGREVWGGDSASRERHRPAAGDVRRVASPAGLGAVLFIPTLALGVWSGTSKFFEALYVMVWYIGPISGLAIFDYMGLSQEALDQGLPFIYLGLTAALLLAALIGRWRQRCGRSVTRRTTTLSPMHS